MALYMSVASILYLRSNLNFVMIYCMNCCGQFSIQYTRTSFFSLIGVWSLDQGGLSLGMRIQGYDENSVHAHSLSMNETKLAVSFSWTYGLIIYLTSNTECVPKNKNRITGFY